MNATDKIVYSLDIVSDTICPWCYIGKKRLETALDLIGAEISFDIRWRPFELNPDMPVEGLDRRFYRSRKFGSWEKSLSLDEQAKRAGADCGLDFHHERIRKTPNTVTSHVLVQVAREAGRQDQVVDAVFKAYFTDGRDVGDPAVLTQIGVDCGLDRDATEAALADESRRDRVKGEAGALAAAGISGVPTLLVDRFARLTGAQHPALIAHALREAVGRHQVAGVGYGMPTHG